MRWGFLLLLALPALADKPAPYYQRTFDKNQDAGATNRNLADITGRNRDKLVPIVGDQSCGPSQALTGATEKGGYIFGGSCTAVGVVVGSSEPANGIPANVTTPTGVSTETITMRGGRPGLATVSGYVVNNTGAQRTYTCQLTQNGVTLDTTQSRIAANATSTNIIFIKVIPSTPSGTVNYVLICNSDSTGTTQTYNNIHVNALEF